ncbi:aldehyde dehydrogenase family protein [Nonomuraea cavernae]|uniref:aldehyde dehydrogenase (NAD(+)) n=1 Tax=Nonomuraea cavernae TaxID=2045107 RepID=A0A917Z9A0_9ACTN|nr:aldehyde dehydrogenase family protein [Nonomuraea cavernae]MCA2188862.1 aldehyde dehydrogenase family protein [Nonomuraea cavernae]GGO78466.1 NAD-dependent succinate-semialdehyde dehydrogenase [Nonomuraea cavernae]
MISRENPARITEIVGHVPVTGPDGVDAAVRRADAECRDWSALPVAARAEILRECGETLAARQEELATLLARESGKPLADCRGEIGFALAYLRWVCDHAPRVLAPSEVDDGAGRLVLSREPYGVVGCVTPWNAPVILALLKLAPALVAGNTAVLKPSPLAPLTVGEVAGALPVVFAVHGGAQTGRALATHPLVRKVAFTGGDVAGREIAASAGAMLTPSVMELGGNDPAVFLPDFSLTAADYERLVMASFATSGQVCMAAKRLYVPRGRAAEFAEAYVAAAERVLVTGDPLTPGVSMGPVVSAAAADRIRALVAASAERGGTAVPLGRVAPGHDPDAGYFVTPVLVTDLDDAAPLVAEEQFGPAVPLLVYDTEEEVLARANAGELGLGASVWSPDEERAFALAGRLEAGFVFVNTHNRTGMSLRAPFGGVKRSGYGREYGEEGLLEYVQTKVVHAPAAFRSGGQGMAPGAYPGTG